MPSDPTQPDHTDAGASTRASEISSGRDTNVDQRIYINPPSPPHSCGPSNLPATSELFLHRETALGELAQHFDKPDAAATVVVRGASGVGKTALAYRYARNYATSYPGGQFVVDFRGTEPNNLHLLAGLLELPYDLKPDQRNERVRCAFGEGGPTLIVYDNVPNAEVLKTWSPPPTRGCHVLATTTQRHWPPGTGSVVELGPFESSEAQDLFSEMVGNDARSDNYAPAVLNAANGLAVTLTALSGAVREALADDDTEQLDEVLKKLQPRTAASLNAAYMLLSDEAKQAAQAAALFEPKRIRRDVLMDLLMTALDWPLLLARKAVSELRRRHVVEGQDGAWQMHDHWALFLRAQSGLSAKVRVAHAEGFMRAVGSVKQTPTSLASSEALLRYPLEPSFWSEMKTEPLEVAEALKELGRWEGARSWIEDAKNSGVGSYEIGDALHELGERSGQNEPLQEAVVAFHAALRETPRERVPLDWAATQNNLGIALSDLGSRSTGTERLEEAVTAYRYALEEYTRERVPLQWAMTQNNLGNALRALGSRSTGTERLEEAVTAFRYALEEYTRERVPLDWAATQNNLGAALWTLGSRSTGTERLEEAVTAFRYALEVRTRERVPLDWAATQNNLGNALRALGSRSTGTERLEEAVTAYRYALEVRTRERVPLDWAATQNNLGAALSDLGERSTGTERLEEAVTAYRYALEEYTRERVPMQWAATQNNLGNALRALGSRSTGTERLEEAVTAYRYALEEYTRERVPLQWAMAQNNLGTALRALGSRSTGTERLEEAVTAYRYALEEYTRERVPLQWAMAQNNLGTALRVLGERGGAERKTLCHAIKAKLCAWEVWLEAMPEWAQSVASDINEMVNKVGASTADEGPPCQNIDPALWERYQEWLANQV